MRVDTHFSIRDDSTVSILTNLVFGSRARKYIVCMLFQDEATASFRNGSMAEITREDETLKIGLK
jgi:hypothetical protein